MKRNQTLFFVLAFAIMIVLAYRIIKENSNSWLRETEEYKAYQTQYYNRFNKDLFNLLEPQENLSFTQTFQETTCNQTASHLEGPQVHLFQFRRRSGTKTDVFNICDENEQGKTAIQKFNISKLMYDPDEYHAGKPNIEISIKQPSLFQIKEKGYGLEKAMNNFKGKDRETPYKTFAKKYVRLNEDSTITNGILNLDVWLTEFTIAVNCSADESEKKRFRYDDFEFDMRVIPNYAPWYTSDSRSFDEKPDIAIGGIYCSGISYGKLIGNNPRELGGEITEVGYPMILKNKQDLAFDNKENIDAIFQNQTIFNKPDTISIYFRNFGTYDLGRPDKVEYTFIMPVIVKGDWSVKLPANFLKNVVMESANYEKGFFGKIFPTWGMKVGRFISIALFALLLIAVAFSIFPVIIPNIISMVIAIPIKLVQKVSKSR